MPPCWWWQGQRIRPSEWRLPWRTCSRSAFAPEALSSRSGSSDPGIARGVCEEFAGGCCANPGAHSATPAGRPVLLRESGGTEPLAADAPSEGRPDTCLRPSDPTLSVLAKHSVRPGELKRIVGFLLGAGVSIGAPVIVLGSSGGIGQLAAALDAVRAGWVLTALLAMLVGYLLLALHLRRLASGEISL